MSEDSKLVEKLENSKKFTEEEMETLSSIQNGYVGIRSDFGQLHMSRMRINEQLDDLEQFEANINQRFQELQETEKKFLEETTSKYGQGTLNPDTGEFTPTTNSEPEKTPK